MQYRRLRVQGGTYFFTVVTKGRAPLFANVEAVRVLQQCISDVRQRHPFDIVAEVILPDHLHTIWSLPECDSDFSTRWMLIKSKASRALAQGRGTIWQHRYWEHLIRNEEDKAAHVAYVHFNPVKHGLVEAPKDWPHSSFQAAVARGELPMEWGSNEKPGWTAEFERRSE